MTTESLVSTAGERSIGMSSATVVPETTQNVSAPTGSAWPVRMTVDDVLDTLKAACAQYVKSIDWAGNAAAPSSERLQ